MKMKIAKLLLVSFFLVGSCKASKWEDNFSNNIDSEESHLDLVFHAVLKIEFEESGQSIAIVDQSVGETTIGLEGYEMKPISSEGIISWNKNIFPYANYQDGNKINELRNSNRKEYLKQIRINGQRGWLELSVPKFSPDKKYALIQVNFYRGLRFNNPSWYILEKKNNRYKVVHLGSMKNL